MRFRGWYLWRCKVSRIKFTRYFCICRLLFRKFCLQWITCSWILFLVSPLLCWTFYDLPSVILYFSYLVCCHSWRSLCCYFERFNILSWCASKDPHQYYYAVYLLYPNRIFECNIYYYCWLPGDSHRNTQELRRWQIIRNYISFHCCWYRN